MSLKVVSEEEVLKAFGLGNLYPVFGEYNVKVAYTSNTMIIYTPLKKEEILLSFETIKKAKEGYSESPLLLSEKSLYAGKILEALDSLGVPWKGLYSVVGGSVLPFDKAGNFGIVTPVEAPQQSSTDDTFKKSEASGIMPAPSEYKDFVFNPDIFKKAPVKLINATDLFQPVISTSIGSRYFVIAIANDIKIAARIKAESVSLRAEGDFNSYASNFLHGGFDKKMDKDGTPYASLHVSVDDQSTLMSFKVIGAAIYSLGIPFGKVATDVGILIGKGA